MTNYKRFWMVYVDAGEAPSHQHATLGEAREEAERLAHKTGRAVYILEAIEVGNLQSVLWEPLGGETP